MIKNQPVSIIKTLSKSKLIRYKSDSYRVDITSTPILEGIIYLSTLVQIIYLFSLTRNAGCYVPFFIAPVEGWKALWAPYTGTSGPITLGDIWAPSGSPWPSLMSKNFKNNIFQQLWGGFRGFYEDWYKNDRLQWNWLINTFNLAPWKAWVDIRLWRCGVPQKCSPKNSQHVSLVPIFTRLWALLNPTCQDASFGTLHRQIGQNIVNIWGSK